MTQRDKLVARFRARPPEVDFDDVVTLLRAFGWYRARQSGSHVSFVKEGEAETIIVPQHNGRKVKKAYIDQICKILKLDNYQDGND